MASENPNLSSRIANYIGNSDFSPVGDLITIGSAGNIVINTKALTGNGNFQIGSVTNGDGNAGNVNITATERVSLSGIEGAGSGILSAVAPSAVGDGANITMTTSSLFASNSTIATSTVGQGNAGDILINASDTLSMGGVSSIQAISSGGGNPGNITIAAETADISFQGGGTGVSTSVVSFEAVLDSLEGSENVSAQLPELLLGIPTLSSGQGGDITIEGRNLSITEGASLFTTTFGRANEEKLANAGNIQIEVANDLTVSDGSQISSETFGQGNAGDIAIAAGNLISFDGVNERGTVSGIRSSVGVLPEALAADFSQSRQGGNINITANSLSLTNGSQVLTSALGIGIAGDININVDNTLTIDGGAEGLLTGLFASVGSGSRGRGGNVFVGNEQFPIQQLSLSNGGQIVVNTFSEGDAGNLFIFADNIDVDGFGNFTSGLFAQVGENATGQGGNINFGSELSPVEQLNMTNGANISVSTFSITDEGNAGNLSIFSNSIELNGEGLLTGLFASVEAGARGQGGNIFVDTNSLTLTDGGRIAANVEDMAEGNGGTLEISANDSIVIDGTTSEGAPSAITSVVNGGLGTVGGIGNAGAVTITTSTLSLINGGRVSATSLGKGNGGDLTIYASESIFIGGFAERFRSGISASAFIDDGNSGDINISTNQLTIENGGTIEASNFDSLGVFTSGTGNPGNININANSIALKDRGRIDAATQSDRAKIGSSANINLEVADNIILRNNSFISAQAFSNANGGNIIVDTEFIIAFPDQNNDIIASAEDGEGGNINISAESLFGIEERSLDPQTNDINASSNFGLDGNISLNVLELDPLQGSVELPDNFISTDELVANSCVVPVGDRSQGKFIITGGESLPVRPGDNLPSRYPTGEVRGVTEENTSSWQPGDPIVEPQGVYRLTNGKLVLSRECSK